METVGIDPEKQEKLKEIIGKLHAGAQAGEVKREFARLIDGVSAAEVASMEQSLIDNGMPVEEVQRLCEVHVKVFEGSLSKGERPERMPGHSIHTMNAENREARARLARLAALARSWAWGADRKAEVAAAMADLAQVTIHYTRKENQLFPYLEKQGFTGPSRVMWGKHDEIRAALKETAAAVENGPRAFRKAFRGLSASMRRMVFMEERILMPESVRRLSDREWAEIRSGEEAIGFAWVKPSSVYDAGLVLSGSVRGGAAPAAAARQAPVAATAGKAPGHATSGAAPADGLLEMAVGRVGLDLLNIALKRMPVDISIVDENDRVLYYSDSPHRIFPRSPAAIGRTVQNCHPQKSVETVNRILQSFRNKERDKASFWIDMGGRFILIEYYALYDDSGAYRGTLEVSQDATGIRALQGQRRLLDWD